MEVELNPFAINAVGIGQAQIHLYARLRSGEIKSISCTVIVSNHVENSGETLGGDKTDGGNGNSGTTNNGSDGTGGSSSGDKENDGEVKEIQEIQGKLIYEFESDVQIAFKLLVDEKEIFLFNLSAEVISGDVKVGLSGNVAVIRFLSDNENYKIKIIATYSGKVVDVVDIQNSL